MGSASKKQRRRKKEGRKGNHKEKNMGKSSPERRSNVEKPGKVT